MTKENKTKYITVLDFEDGNVFQYKAPDLKLPWPDEACEDFLIDKGHNLTNCEWMIHDNKGINREHETHDDIQVIINGHRYKIS